MKGLIAFLILAAALGATKIQRARAEPPAVVASIIPVHSLVAAVMQGVEKPQLLLRGGASPHSYSMRPSDAAAIQNADLVVLVSPSFETFLARPVEQLDERTRVIALLSRPSLIRLPVREGGLWEDHDHEHGRGHGRTGDQDRREEEIDGHVWLDPRNATAIAKIAADALSEIDPANTERYGKNFEVLRERITALESQIQNTVAPVRDRPYLVFHDAYQYFEARFDTHSVGAVAISPERGPGPRRVYELRRRILEQRVRCIFVEPQFPPALAETLVEGTATRIAVLDPLGAQIEAGPNAYFTLMRNLAASLRGCLAAE